MTDDVRQVRIENLPMTQNGGLKVELVPMPSGDNPWRTRADYENEQRRDSVRFWITILSLKRSFPITYPYRSRNSSRVFVWD